jgi:phosphoribosylformimino-5-aminoimidazole carboxamide ribotide isomerase
MELICALDLLDGGVVRLEQGDYRRRIASDHDPAQLAATWTAQGVGRIHVVDLEGARRGRPVHLETLRAIAIAAGDAIVEVGGGLRSEQDVEAVLDAGADEVILGTAAVEQPGFLGDCAARWPGRVLASLDLRQGRPVVAGWLRDEGSDAMATARRLVDEGAARLIVTGTERDGTLAGPDLETLAVYRRSLPDVTLVAAGGIAVLDDLRALQRIGIDGAVVGLALLRGTLDVEAALAHLDASPVAE